MKHRPVPLKSALSLCAALLLLAGCNIGGGVPGSSGNTGEAMLGGPGGQGWFIVDANKSGRATEIRIAEAFWGRLVDIYDGYIDGQTGDVELYDSSLPVFEDFVIGDDVRTDLVDYALIRNAATAKEQLVILADKDDPLPSPALAPKYGTNMNRFWKLLFESEFQRQPILEKSLDPGELPPFTAVPRNACLVLRFDDMVDETTVTLDTVRIGVGNPPITPFEGRLIIDPNHGALADFGGQPGEEFYSTRVIFDSTVSEAESKTTSLPVNSLGLPSAITTTQGNLVMRIPTEVNTSVGQFEILENPSGHPVAFTNNGPVDPTSFTNDVVRVCRSGGDTQVTGDPYNGFLFDDIAPEIIGVQALSIDMVYPPAGVGEYDLDITFGSMGCAVNPDIGDVIETPNNFLLVLEPRTLTPGTASATGVPVRIVAGDPALFSAGPGQFLAAFDSDNDTPECFVRFTPAAGIIPSGEVNPDASLVMRFSEPMDPGSVLAFDNFSMRRDPATAMSLLEEKVVSVVFPSVDLQEFRLTPVTTLSHGAGLAEPYTFEVGRLEEGDADPVYVDLPTDLAGNELVDTIGRISFSLDPSMPSLVTNGKVFDFNVVNMDGDPLNTGDPVDYPEVRGTFLYDLLRGVIRPRPVSRFGAVADASQPVVGAMVPFTQPIQTPMSNLGSHLMNAWRYHDLGLALLDEANHDIDVEGLNWAPFGGQVQIDHFDNYRISLAHSKWLPDEFINTTSLLPTYPQSGLVKGYDNNPLDHVNDPMTIVHQKARGYTVNPIELTTASTGTALFPWPINKGLAISDYTYWTWRNTTVQTTGAPNGQGADTARLDQVTGSMTPVSYPAGLVPTIGLPLLMEFRCYPDDGAFGLNGFTIALAVNGSAKPHFRAFSTGGIDTSGVPHQVNPDNDPVAQGGYDPTSNPPGAKTPGADTSFYLGQADFVVRVSRVVSKWMDVGSGQRAYFAAPIVEPAPLEQPTGTQMVLAYRGATTVTSSGGGGWTNRDQENADNYDAYGNANALGGAGTGCSCTISPTFLNGDATWKSDISEINTARFFQFRVTFVSNTETLLTPELSALGFAYVLD